MQRASTATPGRLHTPASEPTLKRRKTEHTPDSSAPNTPASESKVFADKSEIRAALQAESEAELLAAKRRALVGYANNTIETEWVLDVKLPSQQGVDNADESSEASEHEEEASHLSGRQTYGSFKRKNKTTTSTPASTAKTSGRKVTPPDVDLSEDDDSDDDAASSNESTENKTPSQRKKRKAWAVDYEDDAAMSALDRVDLSKSSYARSKQAGLPFTGAKPKLPQNYVRGRHHGDQRGERHPKKHKDNNKYKQKKKR